MVELRQRVLQKNRSPPPDALRNGDSGGPVPRRSSRRVGPELDDRQSEQRLRATYKNGVITISGLAQRESNLDDGAATDNDSLDANNMTWEDRWLESPSKRRKLDRSGSSQANSPVKESAKVLPSPTTAEFPPAKPLPQNPSAPTRGKSEDELPRSRRGRFGRSQMLFGRSSTNSSRFLNPAASSAKSLRAASFGSPGDLSEAHDQSRLAKDSFDAADNFSSARSTPVHALSPAHSESPSPGPPEQDDGPSGELAETKEPNQLDDHDFPPPFVQFSSLPSSDQFPDEAAYLLTKLFPPMSQPNRFIRALTSHSPSERSTETLLALAENTQNALKAWQDEYLRLDKRTAPVSIPIPKKPATGGRVPAEPATFEAEKQKELYGEGSVLAAAMGIVHAPPGGKSSNNHPAATNNGVPKGTGRELRKRKGDPSVLDGLGISSDDAGGRGVSKRTRRPARRFEIGQNAQEPPEPEPVPAKPVPGRRRRRGGAQGLSQRPTEKEQSARFKRGRIGTLLRDQSLPGSSAATPEAEDDMDRTASRKSTTNDVAQSIEQKGPRAQAQPARGTQSAASRAANTAAAANTAGSTAAVTGKIPIQANTAETTGPSGRRQKAKSEKRSESMTLWWAQRKKKAAEEKMRQMRERGELYGPTEGIMDTSEPINIGINRKRNAAAMNSQANATSAPSAAANKNFHARPMSMSMSHSYGPNPPPPLPPMHHQQQPPPPGPGYMWPNPPTPGAQQRNHAWPPPQPQPFHLPHGQQPQQDSNTHSVRAGQPFSHFPPPPPDHVVLGRGHPGHNYPPPYPPNNAPGGPMPPHPGHRQNQYPHPPYDHRGSHHSGQPPARSPTHHAPPPLLPPPTPSQQHARHHHHHHPPPPDLGQGSPRLSREGDSRGPPPPPPPPPPPRDDSGRPQSRGTQQPPQHYHHPHHPGYAHLARSPPGQHFNQPPGQHQHPQHQHQHQQPKPPQHNYMHVQPLPLSNNPPPAAHQAHPPPPPQAPPSGPPQSGQIHPPPPPPAPPSQGPQQGQSPTEPDQQQPPLQPPRQPNHYYQTQPFAPARFGRY